MSASSSRTSDAPPETVAIRAHFTLPSRRDGRGWNRLTPPRHAQYRFVLPHGHRCCWAFTMYRANVRDNQFDKALYTTTHFPCDGVEAGKISIDTNPWPLASGASRESPIHSRPIGPPIRRIAALTTSLVTSIMPTLPPLSQQKKVSIAVLKEVWDNRTDVSAALDKCYTTDLFTARAKKRIVEHHATDPARPFFMYLAFDTPSRHPRTVDTSLPSRRRLERRPAMGRHAGPHGGSTAAFGTVDSWQHPDYARHLGR